MWQKETNINCQKQEEKEMTSNFFYADDVALLPALHADNRDCNFQKIQSFFEALY